MIKCTSSGKGMIIYLIVGLIKKILNNFFFFFFEWNLFKWFFFNDIFPLQISQYFLKPFRSFGGNINVKVDLSNYLTKTDLKIVTHVDTSSFVLKTNWASLKAEVDKLDIDKLAPVPVDLNKQSNAVKNDLIEKAVYNKLVSKVHNIDTSAFV